MNRNLGISVLIVCFAFSGVNVSLAAQVVEVPPIVVQPYDLSTVNTGLTTQVVEVPPVVVQPYDLSTVNTGLATQVIEVSPVIVQPYGPINSAADDNENLHKIQVLTQRLGEMDKKITRYGGILAEKNKQIAQLIDNLARAQSGAATRDARIKEQEDQIAAMKAKIHADEKIKLEIDSLKQQLLARQDKADQLKQQLDIKTAQSDQMTLMVNDYQKKLESKDNDYNKQLGQILSFKNYKAQMEKQIADLNARLQEKEAEVIRIKKSMYDLKELSSAKDKESQVKDLNLSIESARRGLTLSHNGPLEEKLTQALDKIDQQGRAINTLVRKLQDCGQTVDLTKDLAK
jgi:hypothetical protein